MKRSEAAAAAAVLDALAFAQTAAAAAAGVSPLAGLMPSMAQRIPASPPVSQGFHSSATTTMTSSMTSSTPVTTQAKSSGKKRQRQEKRAQPKPAAAVAPPPPPPPPPPPRPIESQAVINVGGKKYLVVPHPTLPAPSETKKAKKSTTASANLLPLLLKPAEPLSKTGDAMPTFEVEESADGSQLVLLPLDDGSAKPNKVLNVKKPEKPKEPPPPKKKPLPPPPPFKPSSLSSSYDALLQVFRYLSRSELLGAARVCKFWRQVSLHPSLWQDVKLKGCKVTDWPGMAKCLSRVGRVPVLDLRKQVHADPDNQDETWAKMVGVAPALHTVKRIEFPAKMPAKFLNQIVTNMSSSPISILSAICATSISTSFNKKALVEKKEEQKKKNVTALNLDALTSVSGLEEVKVKSSSGKL